MLGRYRLDAGRRGSRQVEAWGSSAIDGTSKEVAEL